MPTHDSMPIVARSMPTSRSHAESVENTSMNGRPAEKPRNSIASTRGCLYARSASIQPCHQGLPGAPTESAGGVLTGRTSR